MIQQNKHKETVTTTVTTTYTTTYTVTVKGIPCVYQLFSLQFNQNLKGGGGRGSSWGRRMVVQRTENL